MVPAGADSIWAEDSGGDGPPLLLLHEAVADARMWDPVWPELTAGRRVIRWDVRGYGRSPAPTEEYTLLADAVTVLDHFGVQTAHVAGCSMGGGAAIQLALAYPDRVRSLTLLCPAIPGYPYPQDPELGAEFEAAVASGDPEALVRAGLKQWGRAGEDPVVTELMRGAVRAFPGQQQFQREGAPVYDRLGELRHVPAVLLTGDRDDPGIIASNEAAAKRMGCDIAWMPGVDHYPTVRAPLSVTSLILHKCASADRDAAATAADAAGASRPRPAAGGSVLRLPAGGNHSRYLPADGGSLRSRRRRRPAGPGSAHGQ
jgi:pimeloyl-ACP methyl ester carboxylesterase